jgi:hypothetical protein
MSSSELPPELTPAPSKSEVSAGTSDLGWKPLPPPPLFAVVRAGAEELHAVGDDLDRLTLGAVLRVPFAPVQPSLDGNRASLGEVVGAVLTLRSPDGDIEVVGLVDPFAALTVLATAVDGNSKLAYGGAAGGRAQLRILGQVPGDHHRVDV